MLMDTVPFLLPLPGMAPAATSGTPKGDPSRKGLSESFERELALMLSVGLVPGSSPVQADTCWWRASGGSQPVGLW